MTPYLITAPTVQPVTLDEMKSHLRVLSTDEDADIETRLAGAVAHLDGWGGVLGRCIMSQTWAIDVTGHGFPPSFEIKQARRWQARWRRGIHQSQWKRRRVLQRGRGKSPHHHPATSGGFRHLAV